MFVLWLFAIKCHVPTAAVQHTVGHDRAAWKADVDVFDNLIVLNLDFHGVAIVQMLLLVPPRHKFRFRCIDLKPTSGEIADFVAAVRAGRRESGGRYIDRYAAQRLSAGGCHGPTND
jgi:hypothetical protein